MCLEDTKKMTLEAGGALAARCNMKDFRAKRSIYKFNASITHFPVAY